MIYARLLYMTALILAAAGPALAQDAAPTSTVKIENFTFNPAALTVKAGTTVIFENADDIPHSIVEKTLAFKSQALDTGDTFKITLNTAGQIDYFCSLHPHMVGHIIVTP